MKLTAMEMSKEEDVSLERVLFAVLEIVNNYVGMSD
jgi:hypothetical protein